MQRIPLLAVVDDDAGMCDAIAELLEVLGFESVRYSSGEALLAELAERTFDCVVSDVRMPGVDGFELACRVEAVFPGLPVIFVSSIDDEPARRRAVEVGGTAFLRKPLDADCFQKTLERVLWRLN